MNYERYYQNFDRVMSNMMDEYGIIQKGKYRHKIGCDSGIVNPITEWVGGSNVIIIGYKCPKCGCETYNGC
jgi:hypothetical protein